MSVMDSAQCPLLPHHSALLDGSGIDPAVRQERGYRSVSVKAELH